MVRVVIINDEGKQVLPKDLSSATELQQTVEKARQLIRECDVLAQTLGKKSLSPQPGKVPYGS